MEGERDIPDETGEGPEKSDAALAEVVVDVGVEEGGDEVAEERDDEQRRDGGVVEVVVCFDLARVSLCSQRRAKAI